MQDFGAEGIAGDVGVGEREEDRIVFSEVCGEEDEVVVAIVEDADEVAVVGCPLLLLVLASKIDSVCLPGGV